MKLLNASAAAWLAGMPLNRFITITWGLGGISADDAVTATGHFIRLASEWMRARGHQMPWIWVHERSDRFGQHAHILLHVPPHLASDFSKMPWRWTKLILPGPYVTKLLQTQRLKFANGHHPEAYRAALRGKVHYMLKCAPVALEQKLNLLGRGPKPWGQVNLVIGKRAGVWQNWRKFAQ